MANSILIVDCKGEVMVKKRAPGSGHSKTPAGTDLQSLAKELQELRSRDIRVGFGNDDHRIEPKEDAIRENRKFKPVVLAGKRIGAQIQRDGDRGEKEVEYSVVANSDGDVVYHAVMNAILLAAGKRDIGYWFPDTDSGGWADKNSEGMVKIVVGMIKEDGWRVNNATVMITAGAPILKDHISEMRANLARVLEIDLQVDQSRIGIGATTGEKLSEVAMKKGIHADAFVSLLRTGMD